MHSSLKTLATKRKKEEKTPIQIVVSTPAGVSVSVRDSIAKKLSKKEYRAAYVKSTIAHGLAHQIRVNREMRAWTQAELAEKCGSTTKQATISRLEDPAYGKHTLNTLVKLASAFDVALVVKFVPYSKFLIETSDKSPCGLFAKSYSGENLFLHQATITITMVNDGHFAVSTPKLSAPEFIRSQEVLISRLEQPRQFFKSINLIQEGKYQNA